MTDELQSIILTLEIEPAALAHMPQQADQQGLTLDQLAARSIGRAASQAETHAGHIWAANAGVRVVERNQPTPRQRVPAPGRKGVRALEREAREQRSERAGGNCLTRRPA